MEPVRREEAVDAIFASLEGSWRLDRRIEGVGIMHGTAVFLRHSPFVLEYNEEGVFTLDSGKEFTAFRNLYYCREEDTIVIRFRLSSKEEDVLHRLHFLRSEGAAWPSEASDEHLCIRDRYLGRYLFEAPDKVRIEIKVQGPEKDALIDTTLSK